MPDIKAVIEYLQDHERYRTEKPYCCLLPPREGFDPDKERVDNLEFETHSDVPITDIRPSKGRISLEDHGFQVLSHATNFSDFTSEEGVRAYKIETEALLRENFGACWARTYDFVLRKNVPLQRKQFDLNDPLHIEGPARGAHNDITYLSGPKVITRYLSDEEKRAFLRPGYRVRIINTWRSLLPVVEDRPLALCDSRSVEPTDLIASDRIIPDRVGENYYLKYNPKHQWYWLSGQTSSEPFAFVMYDTKAGKHARFCPHVSFDNPEAQRGAPPRESVETRSILITKEQPA